MKLKEKYLIILVALCFITVGFYYSYAIFVTKQLQENVVVIKTINHNVSLKVNNQSDKVEIEPGSVKDVSISFTNHHPNQYFYRILVKGIQNGTKVTSNDLVEGLIKGQETKTISVHINNEYREKINLSFYVQASVDENFDNEIGYSYINHQESYDHSGANSPEINNLHLIPVSYYQTSDSEGYWYKTDVNNKEEIWYSYDNGLWANAVLLNDDNYKKYQNAPLKTEIDLGDVLGFYVWIPRFKYYIINSSNYTNYERMTRVVFERQNNTTGTISCLDKISNSLDKHLYSEICSDNYYHHIYDNLSTYTHPSFANKNGFWVSKFLVGEGEKVLPNTHILKKKYEDVNSISSKIMKSHLITNMEYGAIILLSNSSYGKTGNMMYTSPDSTTFQRIYANTYEYELTGCSSEYNIHSKSFITEKTNKCIEYNNLTDSSHYSNSVHYPIGYIGGGASSTGNVYGVYDLSKINGELVSAFVADSNGNVNITNTNNYYDFYSYNDYIGNVASSNNIHNLYRYKLGDAIREHFRSLNINGMWHNGVLSQNKNSGIIVRGGYGSVYTTSIEDINYEAPFRLVLMP